MISYQRLWVMSVDFERYKTVKGYCRRINVKLDPSVLEQFKSFCENEGVTMSEYIREKLKERFQQCDMN
ncbi:hypothetical protein [Nostoc phage N1]|nr:hypothetical protein [Nostoc phage N1]